MVRGLFNKLVSRSLSVAGKWQQQQLRRITIHEYRAAELMRKYGINVPNGVAVSSVDEIKKAIQDVFPTKSELVVKSQILAGGRGLGTFKNGLKGGIHIVKVDQVEDIADHDTSDAHIIAGRKGGTSTEDLSEKFPDRIVKVHIDFFKGITDEDAAKVLDGLAPRVADRKDSIEQVKKLYELFYKCKCTLLEIDPIAETSDKQLVAVDAKLNFYDDDAFRLKFAFRDPTQEDPREAIAIGSGLTEAELETIDYEDDELMLVLDKRQGDMIFSFSRGTDESSSGN